MVPPTKGEIRSGSLSGHGAEHSSGHVEFYLPVEHLGCAVVDDYSGR